jgi:hypothetical protein
MKIRVWPVVRVGGLWAWVVWAWAWAWLDRLARLSVVEVDRYVAVDLGIEAAVEA